MAKITVDYDAIVGPGQSSGLSPAELRDHVALMDVELIYVSSTSR